MERFLRLGDVAEALGVAVRTVYRLIADGALPQPVKVRGRSVLPASSVEAYQRRLMTEAKR